MMITDSLSREQGTGVRQHRALRKPKRSAFWRGIFICFLFSNSNEKEEKYNFGLLAASKNFESCSAKYTEEHCETQS